MEFCKKSNFYFHLFMIIIPAIVMVSARAAAQEKFLVYFSGVSCSGKSTLFASTTKLLDKKGLRYKIISSDEMAIAAAEANGPIKDWLKGVDWEQGQRDAYNEAVKLLEEQGEFDLVIVDGTLRVSYYEKNPPAQHVQVKNVVLYAPLAIIQERLRERNKHSEPDFLAALLATQEKAFASYEYEVRATSMAPPEAYCNKLEMEEGVLYVKGVRKCELVVDSFRTPAETLAEEIFAKLGFLVLAQHGDLPKQGPLAGNASTALAPSAVSPSAVSPSALAPSGENP